MIQEYKGELMFAGFAVVAYMIFAAFGASYNFAYLGIIFGFFGLVVAWKVYESVDDESPGNEKMEEIADAIHEGAMVFLAREYRILAYFILAIFVALIIVIGMQKGLWIGFWTAVAYALGAGCSMAAGFFGRLHS